MLDNQAKQQTELKPSDIDVLKKSASANHAEAQFQLGMAYANGNGLDLDYTQAFNWIQKAVSQNHLQAMRTLAWLYANGFGVEQNDAKAQELCIKLAEQGDPKDQYFLASLYHSGLYGMQPDSKQMIYWYYQAAQQHYARAQYALAKVIMKGVDLEPNDEMVFQWLSLADINGHEKAGEELQKLMQRLPADVVDGFKERMKASIEAANQ